MFLCCKRKLSAEEGEEVAQVIDKRRRRRKLGVIRWPRVAVEVNARADDGGRDPQAKPTLPMRHALAEEKDGERQPPKEQTMRERKTTGDRAGRTDRELRGRVERCFESTKRNDQKQSGHKGGKTGGPNPELELGS